MKSLIYSVFLSLLIGLLSQAVFAQEKMQSYYVNHESEILPDARTAFEKGDYDRTVELCKWYYIIVGKHDADTLRAQAERAKELQSAAEQETAIPGFIKATSIPSGAAIWLDGKDTGLKTPDILENVSAGRHIVDLYLDGFNVFTDIVSVSPGQRSNLSPTLDQIQNDSKDAPGGVYKGHEWVDLGLSVKWATCNIGADSPTKNGDYFSWGEIGTKKDYHLGKYKHGSKSTGDRFKKYITVPKYGPVDNKFKLDGFDDAAHTLWGGSWRMPTVSELEELIENCEWNWIKLGDQNGYRITSKINGNSIFLPAAGCRYETGVFQEGDNAFYWSSLLNVDSPFLATGLSFSNESIKCDNSHRAYGRSIRPVFED